MASPNSVKILDICEVAAAYDSTKSATEKILSPTFFELSGLRFPPSECLWFFKLTDSNPTFFHSVIFPSLKQSLSHALLHFLPIVGGLTWPPESSRPFFVYHLNKDSVTVTLAECNGDFDRLIGNGIHEAVESHPYAPQFVATETRSPLLALQVTFFPNKGFCIGMATHHAIFDGKSTSMFLRAWAYTSKYIVEKGEAPRLLPGEITPSFEWKSIQDSKGLEEAYINLWATIGNRLESGSDSNPRSVKPLPKLEVQPNLLRANFHLSSEVIKNLRESVLRYQPEATDPTKRLNLSTYVLACSYVSICLVKARGGDADREVYFAWSADCRSRLDPPLPPNHFGNTAVVHHFVCKAGDFMQENGLPIIAEKLSASIMGLEKGLIEGSNERLEMLLSLGPEVQLISVAGSTGMEFYNVDFGWGNVEKVEITSIDRTGSFSVLDIRNGSDRRTEIGVALKRPEMESFASFFSNGVKVMPRL
ncbi:hypothetical protein D5086_003421 [Populus alba]|uniref:Uncharacterized protein n=2 Tax=Populus alba TaxID=43335 RepID=A0ACC4D4E8_POPAL|nr:phenolic glucoside malonyltransferase 1-like [Populus alba]TKR86298.1 phenolic glucoside malonyltransferase 1-like [Populus alba]